MRIDQLEKAILSGSAVRETYYGLAVIRFREDSKIAPRGTVIIEERIIYGYPRIGRILSLSAGLKEQFQGHFWVEEKMDGYNVRIFRTGGGVVAVTRGGYICPFTTDRTADFIPPRFFDENPHLVLCVEVVGPDSPYNEEKPSYIESDIRFYVFDVMEMDKTGFLPISRKNELVEKYNLPCATPFGLFQPEEEVPIRSILQKLEREEREGIVFKEEGGGNRRAKYITARSSLNDIAVTSLYFKDFDPEYVTNRILQMAIFLEEEEISSSDAFYNDLGRALVGGIQESIRKFREERRVYRVYRCRFNTKEAAVRMQECLAERVPHGGARNMVLREEEGRWTLEFERIFAKTNGLLGYLLGGGAVFD